MYEKIWESHLVREEPGQPALLYIDRHFVHEGTSPQAFSGLKVAGRKVRRPDLTFAVMDHSVPTRDRHLPMLDTVAAAQFRALDENCRSNGIALFNLESRNQGIVHVIGPELGLTEPGHTIVCGDSHTSTHGAFGALAFGIGTSEVEHVLATQCLVQFKSKTMLVRVTGRRHGGVTAKDVILAIIGKLGISGGNGHVIEYAGEAIRGLSMEGRMTVCNMSIEGGARAGMVAPDETTFAYLEGRPFMPREKAFQEAVDHWKSLASDDGAHFDKVVELDAAAIAPQVTWGMFIGSCTNSRLEDLRAASRVVAGKKVARGLKGALVVPGSMQVKAAAEKEGLDRIFRDAGFEWRDAGCSMCIGMNADVLPSGERCASTSNRNFEGRQGKGGRTHLVSPMMAAAAAIEGHFVDIRGWPEAAASDN